MTTMAEPLLEIDLSNTFAPLYWGKPVKVSTRPHEPNYNRVLRICGFFVVCTPSNESLISTHHLLVLVELRSFKPTYIFPPRKIAALCALRYGPLDIHSYHFDLHRGRQYL